MSPPVQELPSAYRSVPPYRLPHTRTARRVVVPYDRRTHHRRARTCPRRCRNCRVRTDPFLRTVCRLRGRHAELSCPTTEERTSTVGRDHRARRGQELPTANELVHSFRLPLRGRRGDACERRLWRRKRARRSGRIKATDTENRLKYSFQSVFNAVPALHFLDDKVSIAKIRLVPITVSQLKCALHILIGDWYDKWALPTQTEPLIQQDMSPPYGEVHTMLHTKKDGGTVFRLYRRLT